MQSGNEFFSKMLKGLGSGNLEKESEQKKQCDMWVTQQLAKKEETLLNNFVGFLQTQNVLSKSEGSLDHATLAGTASAFGVFADSIRGDDRLKERYLPVALEKLIDIYLSVENATKENEESGIKLRLRIAANLRTIIMVAQHLIFPKMSRILELLHKMKRDSKNDIQALSTQIEENIYPILKHPNSQQYLGTFEVVECITTLCAASEYDETKNITWVINWFNTLLTIETLDLARYIPRFLKYIVKRVNEKNSDRHKGNLGPFLHELREVMLKKGFVQQRKYSLYLLKSLRECTDPYANKKKNIEVFRWFYDILSRLLSHPMLGMDDDLGNIVDNKEVQKLLFEETIANTLQFSLDCLGSDDQPLIDAALRVNNLLKDKLMFIVKYEKDADSSAAFNKVFEILQEKISTQDTTVKNGEGVNKTSDEAMQWIAHLIDNISTEVDSLPSKIIPNLKSDNLRIVESAVKLISKIINKLNTYDMVGTILSELQGKSYEQSKNLKVLKTLFTHVNPESLINHLAKILQGVNHQDIKVYVTQNLDILLNIEEGLAGLRAKILS